MEKLQLIVNLIIAMSIVDDLDLATMKKPNVKDIEEAAQADPKYADIVNISAAERDEAWEAIQLNVKAGTYDDLTPADEAPADEANKSDGLTMVTLLRPYRFKGKRQPVGKQLKLSTEDIAGLPEGWIK